MVTNSNPLPISIMWLDILDVSQGFKASSLTPAIRVVPHSASLSSTLPALSIPVVHSAFARAVIYHAPPQLRFQPFYAHCQVQSEFGICCINHNLSIHQTSAILQPPSEMHLTLPSTLSPPSNKSWICFLLSSFIHQTQKLSSFYLFYVGLSNIQLEVAFVSMSHPQLITQFTTDVIAREDRPCERGRKCGKIIKKGEPCLYVRSINETQPGRFVCASCFKHYETSLSTTRRGADEVEPVASHAPQPWTAHVTSVQRAVNAAQRKSTVHPPQVMAMPPMTGGSIIPQPPIRSHTQLPPTAEGSSQGYGSQRTSYASAPSHPAHSTQPPSTGPIILYPSMQPPILPVPPPGAAGPSRGVGYSPQHAFWPESRQYWSKKVYSNHPVPAVSVPPIETITLDISALYEGGCSRRSRIHGTQFGSISEGKRDVDAQISASELIVLAHELIVPRIKAFAPQFRWREDEFVVRDDSWVDLAKYNNPYQAYFYRDCFVAGTGRKSKSPFFKSQKFVLYVVVPAQQWSEYEAFQEQGTTVNTTAARPTLPGPPSHASRYSYDRHVSKEPEQSLPAVNKPVAKPKPLEIARARTTTNALPDSLFLPTSGSPIGPNPALSSVAATQPVAITGKRGHTHSASVSSPTTKSPPTKRSVTTIESDSPPSCSPDRNRLRDALRSGGDANLNVTDVMKLKRDLIEFYPIPTFSINEILDDSEKRAFDIESATVFSGHLRFDGTAAGLVGVGGFKTTQRAQVMLSTLRPNGIGSQPCQDIVVKRFYYRNKDGDNLPANNVKVRFNRLVVSDELEKLYREANILYWAKSLFQLTVDFIDRAIARATTPPPFVIPRLRFVDAGLLLAVKSNNNNVRGPNGVGSNIHIPYLAEELIPDNEPFIKYIHNGEPVPLPDEGEPGYDLAQFLCFTQHVQYVKTGGLAFITDYQGSGTFLTDPQILTHPNVGAGRELFGEGNLEIGVKLFVTEHVCNDFCRWPGFELPHPASVVDLNL